MMLTDEQITRVDENNMKAKAILTNLTTLKELDPDAQVDVQVLLFAALDFLNETDGIFKAAL